MNTKCHEAGARNHCKGALYLLSVCGRLEMMGPYPAELSYSSNSGAATSL